MHVVGTRSVSLLKCYFCNAHKAQYNNIQQSSSLLQWQPGNWKPVSTAMLQICPEQGSRTRAHPPQRDENQQNESSSFAAKGQNKEFHRTEVHHQHTSIAPQEAAFKLDQIQPPLKRCIWRKEMVETLVVPLQPFPSQLTAPAAPIPAPALWTRRLQRHGAAVGAGTQTHRSRSGIRSLALSIYHHNQNLAPWAPGRVQPAAIGPGGWWHNPWGHLCLKGEETCSVLQKPSWTPLPLAAPFCSAPLQLPKGLFTEIWWNRRVCEGLDVNSLHQMASLALQRHFYWIRNKRIRKRCE